MLKENVLQIKQLIAGKDILTCPKCDRQSLEYIIWHPECICDKCGYDANEKIEGYMKLNMDRINNAARKAAKIFEAMGWTWTARKGRRDAHYVPDVLDIRNTLVNLSKDVGGRVSSSATGRLEARLDPGEKDEIRYYISL